MRIGSNPEKTGKVITVENYHRIVIPVYIPNFEGYFKDAFDIFKLCLESLLLTVHSKTRITIYNNNCNLEVKNYIDKKFNESNYIDQVFHSKENLGKINAILAASKGNLEPLITITDADVFFKNGWQEAVERIFLGFQEAGMVSPVPGSKAYKSYTSNNWSYAVFKAKLFFQDVLDKEALINFDRSLGNNKNLYEPIHLEKHLIIENKSTKTQAVMGCGHFVATMRREVFDEGTNGPAFIKIQNGVEEKFIDIPNEEMGFLRLATKDNYAFHMGNTKEDWMYEEFKKLKEPQTDLSLDAKDISQSKKLGKGYQFFGRIIIKLLSKKAIKKRCFLQLGLASTADY
jgi:hypothetical protein